MEKHKILWETENFRCILIKKKDHDHTPVYAFEYVDGLDNLGVKRWYCITQTHKFEDAMRELCDKMTEEK